MKKSFTVTLARPGRHLISFEAKALQLPGDRGSLGILAGRQPLLTVMEPGVISILEITEHRRLFATTGGFCEMIDNEATLLCDSLITVEELEAEGAAGEKQLQQAQAQPAPPATKNYRRDFTKMSEAEKHAYALTLLRNALIHER